MADHQGDEPREKASTSPDADAQRQRRAEMASLVRSIQQEVERKEERIQKRRRVERRSLKTYYVGAGVLTLLNLLLLFAAPSWLVPSSPDAPSAMEEELSLRLTLALFAEEVERQRGPGGEVPESVDLPVPLQMELVYRTTGSESYELLGDAGGVRLVYSSIQPRDRFLAGTAGAFRVGGS